MRAALCLPLGGWCPASRNHERETERGAGVAPLWNAAMPDPGIDDAGFGHTRRAFESASLSAWAQRHATGRARAASGRLHQHPGGSHHFFLLSGLPTATPAGPVDPSASRRFVLAVDGCPEECAGRGPGQGLRRDQRGARAREQRDCSRARPCCAAAAARDPRLPRRLHPAGHLPGHAHGAAACAHRPAPAQCARGPAPRFLPCTLHARESTSRPQPPRAV